jgi:hypothetical protein
MRRGTLSQFLSDLEHHYRTVELPRVRAQVRAFVQEMGEHGKCIRLMSLIERLQEAKDDLTDRYRRYERSRAADQPYVERAFIASYIPDDEKRIEKLKRQTRALLSTEEGKIQKDGITPDMIDRARDYPIESLIGTNGRRGNVLCIAHEETNPSMSLKGNRARCFSCGYFGDTIDVYMKLHGVGFVEAVRALQ